MANLLANPELWNDGTNTPPAQWNGSAYVISDNNGRIYLAQAPVSGDTLQFTLSSSFSGDEIQYNDNAGGSSPVYSATSTPTAHTFTLPVNGATSRYIEGLNNSGGCGGMITIAPPAVPPVAPDEGYQFAENSAGVTFTPQITVGGSPVTPTSLAIVTQASNGLAIVSGASITYTPNTGFNGYDSFMYTATYGGLTSEPAEVDITVTPIPCQELGRVTRAYVSGYFRNRVHVSRLYRGEIRCLTANFNGALCAGRTITSVVWSVLNPLYVNLSQCDITDRETSCLVAAQYWGESVVRCVATMDNGEQYTQMFRLDILPSPWFQGDQPTPTGPYNISAQAIT